MTAKLLLNSPVDRLQAQFVERSGFDPGFDFVDEAAVMVKVQSRPSGPNLPTDRRDVSVLCDGPVTEFGVGGGA